METAKSNMSDYITKSLAGLKVFENTIRLIPIELAALARSGNGWAIDEIRRIEKHNSELNQSFLTIVGEDKKSV